VDQRINRRPVILVGHIRQDDGAVLQDVPERVERGGNYDGCVTMYQIWIIHEVDLRARETTVS